MSVYVVQEEEVRRGSRRGEERRGGRERSWSYLGGEQKWKLISVDY